MNTALTQQLIARCRGLDPIRTAIVCPHDRLALASAIAAASSELIVPVLVGEEATIAAVARLDNLDVSRFEVVAAHDPPSAAACAVELARTGSVGALMKGSLRSSQLLHRITAPESGLHAGRRISHAYVMQLERYPDPLLITDGVVNILPTLEQKRDIAQNAVDLAHTIGISEIRVAALSAVETVSAAIPSTVDAAALAKMAQRDQIQGALVEGPLALDDAIDLDVAREKNLDSPVAGRANVLLVPNFESANMLAKALILLAGAPAAGVVLGASVPVALTSRADGVAVHVASLAIARLLVESARNP